MKIKNIVAELLKIARELTSFDMTERQWEKYHKKHPHAQKHNHHIIPTEDETGKSEEEIRKIERKAKVEYFRKLKKEHPNYRPIIGKKELENTIFHGTYSCISAWSSPHDNPEERNNIEFLKARRENLRKDLDRLGVKYTEIIGFYGGEESSFLIPHTVKASCENKSEPNIEMVTDYGKNKDIIKQLNDLGQKYNQDSVAHAKNGSMEIHFTKGEHAGYSCKGTRTNVGASEFGYSEGRIGDSEYTTWNCQIEGMMDGKYVKNPNIVIQK